MYRTRNIAANRPPFAYFATPCRLWVDAFGEGNTMLDLSKTTSPVAAIDFAAIKQRQQAAWSAGDYAVVADEFS